MTKAELRRIFLEWARGDGEAVAVLEAVGKYLGNPENKPKEKGKP